MTAASHGDVHGEEAISRVCVKNLPPKVDAARLREHFSARGEVTDAKVLHTRHATPGAVSVEAVSRL